MPTPSLTRVSFFSAVCLTMATCYQHEAPKSKITFPIFTQDGVRYDLKKWLEKSVPGPIAGECKPTWDLFYFRVNGFGKVDSLYHRGDLRPEITETIIRNIYETEGHWQLAKDTNPTVSSWFMFSYFDYGAAFAPTSRCSETDKLLQQKIMRLGTNLSLLQYEIEEKKVVIINPSTNGGGVNRMD